jgi:hypothetical protein
MKFLNIIKVVLSVLPYLFKVIPLVEEVVDKPHSGQAKKALVLDGARTAVQIVTNMSTGGQKDTWMSIKDPVDNLIDSTVEILNRTGVFRDKAPAAATGDVGR